MAKIVLNFDEVQESRPVPNGRYDVVVASAEAKNSKAGKPQIVVSLGIIGHETAPNVSHYISLPSGDDPKADNYKALLLKRFLAAFKIAHDSSGFDVDDFAGSSATVELTLSEPNDEGSVYNRLQLPRLTEENNIGVTKSTAAKPPKR